MLSGSFSEMFNVLHIGLCESEGSAFEALLLSLIISMDWMPHCCMTFEAAILLSISIVFTKLVLFEPVGCD